MKIEIDASDLVLSMSYDSIRTRRTLFKISFEVYVRAQWVLNLCCIERVCKLVNVVL